MSLVQSAKLCGHDPHAYLRDVEKDQRGEASHEVGMASGYVIGVSDALSGRGTLFS
jgi:hypothetical protein